MKSAGVAVLLALLVASCGESGNRTAGPAAGSAPGAAPVDKQAPSSKGSTEPEVKRPQLPPSEPYGTTGN